MNSQAGQTDAPEHIRQLTDLNLISTDTSEVHWPRTRDTDIPVLRDTQSDVIFLSRLPDLKLHYAQKTIGKRPEAEVQTNSGVVRLKRNEDLERRLSQTKALAVGKRVCDFGTGQGLYLDAISEVSAATCGIEIRADLSELIAKRLGSKVEIASDISATAGSFDLVTLFHVLEHVPDQLGVLKSIHSALAPGGRVFVEVPHARDFLSHELALPDYRDFIYWSEHLVLHTRESLSAFLTAAGFRRIRIEPLQRYAFSNHLYWLHKQKPGGHEHYAHMSSPDLDRAYAAQLAELDRTDTLVAIAEK
ncbi:class I SAM-dependent methyltransferase [Roseibium polysiphoniae]|uniref:class I SAM-dependent methyltransferase n=1 Tax=Roseibium polysiphoniae TaxID=2571221 RepID=UPI0032994FC3